MKNYFKKQDEEFKESMYLYWTISCTIIVLTAAVCTFLGI